MILTSNTEATESKVKFLNYSIHGKGFQCHSNNLLQLFELKDNNNNNKINFESSGKEAQLDKDFTIVSRRD